jgi:stage II sporulation protein M
MDSGLIRGPRQFLSYLYGIWPFIAVVVALFLLSCMAGYMMPSATPGASDALLSGLKGKAESITSQSPPMVMLSIFANNAMVALVAMLAGLAAGLFPAFFVVSNGLIIGIMLETIVRNLGVVGGVAVFAAGILPHGIIELPAVLISTAIGLNLGYAVLRAVFTGKGFVVAEIKTGLRMFLSWIVPALVVAAFIETYVTAAILAAFASVPIFQ